MQDAEERREKGVTMNSILNSLFTSFDWFFFLTFEEKKREKQRKEKKRKREFEKKSNTNTDTRRERKFLTRFWSKKKCLKLHQPFLSKHQRVLTS